MCDDTGANPECARGGGVNHLLTENGGGGRMPDTPYAGSATVIGQVMRYSCCHVKPTYWSSRFKSFWVDFKLFVHVGLYM